MSLAALVFLVPLPCAISQDTRIPVRAEAPRGWTVAQRAMDHFRNLHAQRALAGLRTATAELTAWCELAERGERLDTECVEELLRELRAVGDHAQSLHRRAIAQELARRNAVAHGAVQTPGPVPADHALRPAAAEIAKVWIEDMRAFGEGSATRRDRALQHMRAALGSNDGTAALAALMTLQQSGDVEFDKASFRPIVLPFARQAGGHTLASAFYALNAVGRESEDLQLVHEAWARDPHALRGCIAHLLHLFGDGTITGRSEEIALAQLADYDHRHRQALSGFWGARVGPRLEARLIELARSPDHEVRDDAIYFGLSTLQGKSEAVVDLLIEALADPDWTNKGGRALWGLGQGVPESLQSKVAAALVEFHNARSDPGIRRSCARLVEQYGGPAATSRLVR
jgi:hypothetical protein